MYDINGYFDSEGKYENGLKIGHWKEYHLNGKVKSEGNYEKGKKMEFGKNIMKLVF